MLRLGCVPPCFISAALASLLAAPIAAQTASREEAIERMRADQIPRLQRYVLDAIQPSGLVRDSLVLDPAANHFHPATPDAAGFALVSLAGFDRLGTLADADRRVVDILRAYNGLTPGVNPARSADGHFLHFLDVSTGGDPPGWDDSYSPISSALIVGGAQFARNHFAQTDSPLAGEIDRLTRKLTDSIDFDAAIHPSLDGRVFLDMTAGGGGAGGAVRPWNEYQLVVSLALRQAEHERATAVKHLWLNPDNAPSASRFGLSTLTDRAGAFAPAFWVQQANAFNGDFRHSEAFQEAWRNHQVVDRAYSITTLDEAYRYGLTAGVSPSGYAADRLFDHPGEVFSPEAVAAWGDMGTLLRFFEDQPPDADPRRRYGLTRVSDASPTWKPFDAGLVDHTFLLFGLLESVDPSFFGERVFAPLVAGDFNGDQLVDAADYTLWRDARDLSADADLDGAIGPEDLAVWVDAYRGSVPNSDAHPAPEPLGAVLTAACWIASFALIPARRG